MLLLTFIAFAASFSPLLAQTVEYQAENGVLSGTEVQTTEVGYTGTGYVGSFDAATDNLTFTVKSDALKLYDLNVTYQAPYGEKYTSLSLNGAGAGQIHFPAINTFTAVAGGQVLLNAGNNTITFNTNWGWYNIDKISLAPSAPRAPHRVSSLTVNPRTTPHTKNLLKYLIRNYGSRILSGQQDPASYAWVEQNVGESPAMLGLDMMDYSPSRVEHGTNSTAVEDAITFNARGGIITFVWHWNAPSGLIDTIEHPWWSGFYTDATTFNLATALANKTSADYKLLIRDIDAISVQLLRLQKAGISVLWRPLHEADGGWFWWGRDQNPAPAKELYRILYNRLTTVHGLNNLLWVWNSVNPDWWPGDDVVDIASYDSYPTKGDHGPVSVQYNSLVSLTKDRKLIALAEVGTIPDAELLKAYEADWSFFMTWGGEFIQDGLSNSLDFLKKLYKNDFVLNLPDVKGWQKG
ncbi:mannan endo-1,4-beta-mannosidase-like protein [Mycena rebaudengoi]|nr:mannan endo-1,4-beta-mannosidase-like protein [Mycena rebaudengoi]